MKIIETQILRWIIRTTKMPKKYIKALNNLFYELAPLTRDVICSKLWRDRENILVLFCQTNTLLQEINPYFEIWNNLTVKSNMQLKNQYIVIPPSCRHQIIRIVHVNHQDIHKIKSLLREMVWWSTIRTLNNSMEQVTHVKSKHNHRLNIY